MGSRSVRAADRGLRPGRARASCARPTTRSGVRTFAQRHGAKTARSWPAAACSAWRRRTRCTSSGCGRPCSSAPTACSSASSTQRAAALLQRYLEGLGLEIIDRAPRRRRAVGARPRGPRSQLADGRRLRRRPLARRGGHRSPTRAGQAGRAGRPTAACSSTRACRPATRTSSRPATSPSSRARSRPLADRGRPGRGRGRRRGRRRQALRPGRPGDDPQSRGHRTRRRSAASKRPARTRRRSPSKTPPGVTASSWWRTAASWARSSLGSPRRSRPSAPRSPAASTCTHQLPTLRAGPLGRLAGMSGEIPLAPAVPA